MHVCLFHNPTAGTGEHSREDLEATLRAADHRVHSYPVPRLKEALPDLGDADLVVVAGGDGAVRKTLLRGKELERPCTILPLGTANNVANSLGLCGTPEELVRRWPEFRMRHVDLWTVAAPWGSEPFVEGVGVGVLARAMELIEELDARSSWCFSRPADELYRDACGVALLAAELPSFSAELRVDGKRERVKALAIEISNFGRGGPGLRLASRADPGDGHLDLVVVTDREALMHLAMDSLSGRGPVPKLTTRRARRVVLTCPRVPCHVDDKLRTLKKEGAELRLDVQVAEHGVQVLAPLLPQP